MPDPRRLTPGVLVDARLADLRAVGALEDVGHEMVRWTAVFDTDQVKRLYATFSPISALDAGERDRILEALGRVADDDFGACVERPMVMPIYVARRR